MQDNNNNKGKISSKKSKQKEASKITKTSKGQGMTSKQSNSSSVNDTGKCVSIGEATKIDEDACIHCDHEVFVAIIMEMMKVKSSKCIAKIIAHANFIVSILKSIDADIEICKCDETLTKDLMCAHALSGGNNAAFPTSLSDLKKFFQGVHTRDSPKLHMQLHLGTNIKPQDLISEAHSLLCTALDKDDPSSCNAGVHKKHLQHPFAEDAVGLLACI